MPQLAPDRFESSQQTEDRSSNACDIVVAYPEIGDQLDALWKGGDAEAAMKVIVDKVKSDNPKP